MNRLFVLFLILMMGTGCASVPKEVVELSYAASNDVRALHESYDQLITAYFDQLRARRINYVEQEWAPHFIQEMVAAGRIDEVVQQKIIITESGFAEPDSSSNKHLQMVNSIGQWATATLTMVENKKQELIAPLDSTERALRADVNAAFAQVVQANATITAQLNSLRKVQEVQDDALKALNIAALRDKINMALAEASSKAVQGLQLVEEKEESILTNLSALDNALN